MAATATAMAATAGRLPRLMGLPRLDATDCGPPSPAWSVGSEATLGGGCPHGTGDEEEGACYACLTSPFAEFAAKVGGRGPLDSLASCATLRGEDPDAAPAGGRRRVRFDPAVAVHETWASGEYDRGSALPGLPAVDEEGGWAWLDLGTGPMEALGMPPPDCLPGVPGGEWTRPWREGSLDLVAGSAAEVPPRRRSLFDRTWGGVRGFPAAAWAAAGALRDMGGAA